MFSLCQKLLSLVVKANDVIEVGIGGMGGWIHYFVQIQAHVWDAYRRYTSTRHCIPSPPHLKVRSVCAGVVAWSGSRTGTMQALTTFCDKPDSFSKIW